MQCLCIIDGFVVNQQSIKIQQHKSNSKEETRRKIAQLRDEKIQVYFAYLLFLIFTFKINLEMSQMYNAKRDAQIACWKKKTEKSPYAVDLNKYEKGVSERHAALKAKMDKLLAEKQEFESLTGIPKEDACSEEFIENITDTELKFAFEYRKLYREFSVVCEEESKLNEIMSRQMQNAGRKFSHLIDHSNTSK